MADLVEQRTNWKFDKQPLSDERISSLRANNPGKDLKLKGTPAEQLQEVYEKLEAAVDRCENVANIIESVIIKHT